MGCKPCARRRKAMLKAAEAEYLLAERKAKEGKITEAALAKAKARALRAGVKVFALAGSALGIHGEVEDGQERTQSEDPEAGGSTG